MKKRIVLALIATLTLTLGSFGTVFAMNSNPVIELQTNESLKQNGETTDPEEPEEPEHVHTWGEPTWHKIADAVYEPVKVIDQEEKWDWVTNIITPAWDEDVTEVHTVCYTCGYDFSANNSTEEELIAHIKNHMHNGEEGRYGSREVVVDTIHHEAVTEDVWTKVQDEISHYEDKLVTPEDGYWEHTCTVCGEIQNSETGEVIKPGTLPDEPENPGTDDPTTEEPENPNPDDPTTEEPENPNPDDPTTEEPENPNTGDNTGDQTETPNEDTQNPTDDSQNPVEDTQDQQKNSDKTTTTVSADNNDKTAQTADNKEQSNTATTVESNKNTAPQTGDTTSLISLFTLAGSAVTGGTAFGLRKKFKK